VDRRIEAGYWRDVIGAEYAGLPGLSLTVAQAMRLWSIDEDIARHALDSYVESGYLLVTADGRYRRTDLAQFADEEPATRPAPPRTSAAGRSSM
jgi:hypothetical protein